MFIGFVQNAELSYEGNRGLPEVSFNLLSSPNLIFLRDRFRFVIIQLYH